MRPARCYRPAAAIALLLGLLVTTATAAVDHIEVAPGICPSLDVRNTADQLMRLQGCRVIEGHLSIVLMERTTPQSFENISFPELREVTGYIKIYRMKGVQNLGYLFPNLSVVRGMQLFKDFAIVVFDNENLQALGLRSLYKVERGAVRIQHNDQLCYTNTIDWSRIIADGVENNIIRNNYDLRLCGLCPNAQSRMEDRSQSAVQCPADVNGRLLCWDDEHCQKMCPMRCVEGRACTEDGSTCCHENCLGGCDGPASSQCHVCRDFSYQYGAQRTCVKHCPAGTYELFRRCVTEQECRRMPPPVPDNAVTEPAPAPNIPAYKIFNGTKCVYVCPSGYVEEGTKENATCQRCPASGCVHECGDGKIESISSAERFRGCTHIKGTLEISLRALGGNTMAILESLLGEIRVIEGSLRVTRSYPLVSLMFLKNLRTIGGNAPDQKGQSLYIFNNPNLELLWDWPVHGDIEILKGKLFVHFNPKLCYSQILPLKNMTKSKESTFDEIEVSEDNNGEQASCFKTMLKASVQTIRRNAAVLQWDMFCPADIRKLLGYSVYYVVAEHNVTLYGQRDACSDTWSVLDITMDEVMRNNMPSTLKSQSTKNLLDNQCAEFQPVFSPLTNLIPYTRYAAYIKTYTTLQDKNGAQSPIFYFRTMPGNPSPPLGLTVELTSSNTVHIKWSPPAMPNGTISIYHVEIQANSYNRPKILSGNNYCNNPNALSSIITVRGEEMSEKHQEKVTGDVAMNGSCACQENERSGLGPYQGGTPIVISGSGAGSRFNSRAEAERIESIEFENQLQNEVYKRKDKEKQKQRPVPKSRRRRSIDNSLDSMLVILSQNNRPRPGLNYTNTTEGSYVKSQYYELPGEARVLVVNELRHFTWYTVNIWACRAMHPNETQKDYEESWCSSERAFYTFRTLELKDADVVTSVRAELLSSNKTQPEVNVTWDPPKNPNGFVISYMVHHARAESTPGQEAGLHSCITAEEYENNGHGHLLRNLAPGNYSVKVTPVTVRGAGNASAEVYVIIPERTMESGYEWVWGVVMVIVVVLVLVAVGAWYVRRELLQPAEASKLIASVNPEYVSTMYVPDEWEVPRENITFIKELGQGSFGMVYEGIAKNIVKGTPETRCAVKTVNEHATERERIEFLNEASVMKAFDTFHVVRLLGVVSRVQPTLVVMELMECGDLKTYLRSHRPDSDGSVPKQPGGNPPTLQNILQMAIEIADGMAYLSAKKFVHRDLAARNCMVAGDLTVKVGDFGMTRDIYETDYYRKGTKGLLPVRWMSPESLKDGVFSSYSDVWSYGVVLWEMATLAMQPYQGLSNEQVVRYVGEGGVMERPEHCPDRLYELMRQCWAHRPVARPSFLQLVADLAPTAAPYFRHRSFFHTPQGQEFYALHRTTLDEDQEMLEVNVGAVATGSTSNLFGVSQRLKSWLRDVSSQPSRGSEDAAAEPLQPIRARSKRGPNGVLRDADAGQDGQSPSQPDSAPTAVAGC